MSRLLIGKREPHVPGGVPQAASPLVTMFTEDAVAPPASRSAKPGVDHDDPSSRPAEDERRAVRRSW